MNTLHGGGLRCVMLVRADLALRRNGYGDCHVHGSGYLGHIIPPPHSHAPAPAPASPAPSTPSSASSAPLSLSARDRCPELNRAIQSVRYIAAFTKEEIENGKAKEDWKFVAMVLDRLFLWIFSVAVVGQYE